MSNEKTGRQSRIDNLLVSDVVTVSASPDATRWEVVTIDGLNLTIREHGTNHATQQFPKDCVYDVVSEQMETEQEKKE